MALVVLARGAVTWDRDPADLAGRRDAPKKWGGSVIDRLQVARSGSQDPIGISGSQQRLIGLMGAVFRPYERRDRQALLGMYESFEPKGVYMGLPPLRGCQTEAWLRGLLADPRNAHFVLWTGRHVIAHAALIYYPNMPESREIIIFVHQDHQGRGWGRKTFRALLEWASRQHGIADVWLLVDWHNTRARRLYASLGFTGRPTGLKDPETLMRRRFVSPRVSRSCLCRDA